jgi:cobalamin synthase
MTGGPERPSALYEAPRRLSHRTPWQRRLLTLALAAGLVALVGAWRFSRDLGGITGDTLGAVVKLAELTTYVAAAAWAARA